MASCQELGIILVIKSDLKIDVIKNVLLNWYFSMKKNEKDSDDF